MEDIDLKKRLGIRKDALKQQRHRLRDAGVECELHETGITGTYKGEPFVVYAAFIFPTGKQRPDVWILEIRTRYKGTETPKRLPLDVLKGG